MSQAVAERGITAQEDKLRSDIEQLTYSFLAFIYYAFDWGVPGTPLENQSGPDDWQIEIAKAVDAGLLTLGQAIRLAVRSGHGIGKTAFIAWLILWFMCTRPHPQIVVTANTKSQLSTKTWRELAVWHKRLVCSHWFKMAGTSFYHIDHPKTWCANMIPWSKENSEAFAGTHEKHVLVIFDEASAIPSIIWEVADGAMSGKAKEGEPMTKMFIAFGNPTQNKGRFSDCFKRLRARWKTWEIDSRTAKMYDQKLAEELIEDNGIDSDIVRVRVLGKEPRAGFLQFIGADIVEAAMARKTHEADYGYAPKIIGVDIARSGSDQTVLFFRQGIAQARKSIKLRKDDSMYIGDLIKQHSDDWDADGVVIDMGNIGAAVYDYCTRKLHMDNVHGVWFGGASTDIQYFNKRAQMWGNMKDWLKNGGVLHEDRELEDDLTGPEVVTRHEDGKIQLESKDHMTKIRLLASPDTADALACTFGVSVERKDRMKEAIAQAGFAKGRTDEYSRPGYRSQRGKR